MIQGKHPSIQVSRDRAAGAVYVDNFAVVSTSKSQCNDLLSRCTKALEKNGLVVHEVTDASSSCEFVGMELRDNRISVKRSRLWKLKYALECLLARGKCSGLL